MATSTYTPIASITLGSSASSVTFSSIPQDYRDLVLVVDGTGSNIINLSVNLNSDSASNYSWVAAIGNGSSDTGDSAANVSLPETGRMSTTQSSNILQIMDYSATDKYTTILARANSSGDQVSMSATRWADTSAVTSIDAIVEPSPRLFQAGTTFALYGIAA